MRVLCLLAVLLTSAASQAQPTQQEPPRPAGVIPLAVGGALGSMATLLIVTPVLTYAVPVGDVEGVLILQAGSALGAAGGVILTRNALGADGADGHALLGAFVGAVAATATSVPLLLLVDGQPATRLSWYYAGLATVLMPTALAVRGARVVPTALVAPTGERTAGLTLSVGL